MITTLRISLALLPVILVTGCGAKSSPAKIQNTESTSIRPVPSHADVSAPVLAKIQLGQTTVPITGALGWVLGVKKPISMLDDPSGMSDVPVTNAPPFTEARLLTLKDGTIYEIVTWVDLFHFPDVERALNDKYGPPADLRTTSDFKAWGVSEAVLDDFKGRVLLWTNSGCTVELLVDQRNGNTESTLSYCNKPLQDRSFQETADENAGRASKLAPKL